MPRAHTTETADRIRSAALELIAAKGAHQVSLREIAERVGVSEPALYYHFGSHEDMLRSLAQPLADDAATALAGFGPDAGPRELLGTCFDVTYRHRDIIAMLLHEPGILAVVGLAAAVARWRARMVGLLVGGFPRPADVVRAEMALGGLVCCTVVLCGTMPLDALRAAVLDAACDTLRTATGPSPRRG